MVKIKVKQFNFSQDSWQYLVNLNQHLYITKFCFFQKLNDIWKLNIEMKAIYVEIKVINETHKKES